MHEVRVPKLGATMTETQLIEWVVKEGEEVKPRQVLEVLQTEKTSYELESQHAVYCVKARQMKQKKKRVCSSRVRGGILLQKRYSLLMRCSIGHQN